MNVTEFVNRYLMCNIDTQQEQLIHDRLKNKYIPIQQKIDLCYYIVNTANITQGLYKQNSALQYVLYLLVLIDLYTDIIVDSVRSVDIDLLYSDYDKLKSNALIERLLNLIPENESSEFSFLIDSISADIKENMLQLL